MRKVESIAELRTICQASKKKASTTLFCARFKTVSIYITKVLLYTPVTANQVSVLRVLVGIGAGVLFVFGSYWYSIAGALVLFLSYALDFVDGEIARYRGTTSVKGEYYDDLGHDIIYPVLFICMSFGVYRNFHDVLIFAFGCSAALAYLLQRVEIRIPSWNSERGNTKPSTGIASRFMVRIISIKEKVFYIVDPVLVAVILGAIFDGMAIVLILFGIAYPAFYIARIVQNRVATSPDS